MDRTAASGVSSDMTSSAAEVGGFRLGERLHTGRNAVVFRAVRPTDGRRAVIKLPAADYPSQNVLDRFRSEYEILRRLDDPRIVRPIDLVQHGNSLALVLEPAPGLRLRDFLGGRRLPLTDFLRIASGLAGGLAAVHAKDVLHKDVNPGNVVVDPATLAVRLWFTSPRHCRESTRAARGLLEGRSPTSRRSRPGRMTARWTKGDLYSLGVVHEMLTGRPPFVSSDRRSWCRSPSRGRGANAAASGSAGDDLPDRDAPAREDARAALPGRRGLAAD
jgi:serine/threonine protein kinase